jgi:hypothetical protein
VAYRYLGDDQRYYPQYRNVADGTPLTVAPGGSYDMEPIILAMPVPPDDGRWELPEGEPENAAEDKDKDKGLPPRALLTGTSTEGEDN